MKTPPAPSPEVNPVGQPRVNKPKHPHLRRRIGGLFVLLLTALAALGQPAVPPPKVTPFTRPLIGTNVDAAGFRSALGFVSTNISSVTNYAGNGAAITNLNADELRSGTVPSARIGDGSLTTNKIDSTFYGWVASQASSGSGGAGSATNVFFLASSNVTPSTVSGSNVFTVTGTVPLATANAFSEAYTAWVSKSGDDSTGTVGKQALPFLTVSNAVQAVKLALGSSSSGGLVFISPGVYGETWINLQRTNKTGISLFGQGDVWLTATSSGLLTTYGPLVTVGHSSKVMGLNISNNISAAVKQAAIGWDTSKSASLGTTLVCATNVYINVPIGLGSSDVGYFYDSSASGDGEVTVDGCNWQSKWDCFFLSTTSFEISTTIRNSSLTVNQPSNYDFPGGGSGSGRARAAFIGDGHLTVHNFRILALSSTAASNETSGLTFNGTLYDWTNINSSFQAQGTAGTIKDINDQGLRQDYGRISPQSLATNAPAAGKTLQATSPFSSAWVTASGSGDVTQSGQNNFSGSNYFGGLSRFAGPVGLSNITIINNSTWSVNNLIWSYSTGKEIWNYGNINITNNPLTTFDWWDASGETFLMQLEPDSVGADPHVFLLNPRGNGAGFTNIPAAQLTGTIPHAVIPSYVVTNNFAGTITTATIRATSIYPLNITASNRVAYLGADGTITNAGAASSATTLLASDGSGITAGSGVTISGGQISSSGGSASFVSIPRTVTNAPITQNKRFASAGWRPSGTTAALCGWGVLGAASFSGTLTLQNGNESNSPRSRFINSGTLGGFAATGLFSATNRAFHLSVLVAFTNGVTSTNYNIVALGSSADASGDSNPRIGWRANTDNMIGTNWVAEYHNGSTFVPIHTNSATCDVMHELGIWGDGSIVVWSMDGVNVATNSTTANMPNGNAVGVKVMQKSNASQGAIFLQSIDLAYEVYSSGTSQQ